MKSTALKVKQLGKSSAHQLGVGSSYSWGWGVCIISAAGEPLVCMLVSRCTHCVNWAIHNTDTCTAGLSSWHVCQSLTNGFALLTTCCLAVVPTHLCLVPNLTQLWVNPVRANCAFIVCGTSAVLVRMLCGFTHLLSAPPWKQHNSTLTFCVPPLSTTRSSQIHCMQLLKAIPFQPCRLFGAHHAFSMLVSECYYTTCKYITCEHVVSGRHSGAGGQSWWSHSSRRGMGRRSTTTTTSTYTG